MMMMIHSVRDRWLPYIYPNYSELSNWWRSHERKLLHERVIGCTNHLGECDINFHWAETLAVMYLSSPSHWQQCRAILPRSTVPPLSLSLFPSLLLPYFLSYFRERKLAPVSQRSEIAANLLDSLSAAAARDVGDICGIFSLYYQIFTGNLKNYHG